MYGSRLFVRLNFSDEVQWAPIDCRAGIQGGVSDANNIADNGVPVIDGLGPYGKNAHSLQDHDEWFDPESLRKKTKALARYLLEETTW